MGPLAVSGLISGGVQLLGGLFSMGAARSREQAAQRRAEQAQAALSNLEKNRQEVINPYENTTDLSSMLNNPYAQLGVATQAAEMQAEEADISLANTLDTLRATGAGAGGATALAQAALKSKKGVSASIEQQEAANEKARAQGEANLQQQKMSEAQRIQGADAAGKQFMFGAQEQRDNAKMDRLSAQLSGAQQQQMQAGADATGALTGMIGGLASTAGSFMSGTARVNAANVTGTTGGSGASPFASFFNPDGSVKTE